MEEILQRISESQQGYPRRLRSLPDMPACLYVRGRLPKEEQLTIGMVGARSCSGYGRHVAWEYARVFSDHGVQVISGMALGIDGESHRGALQGPTPTFAVLGCGADVCYPKSNRDLYEKIPLNGGLISEYPPGAPPAGWHFPARNRIISGLSDALLVIEAKKKSGSLITVDCALEQGKTVFAGPGRVTDTVSEGCNGLISQGAVIALSPEMVLNELGMDTYSTKGSGKKKQIGLARDLDLVYSCVDFQPTDHETLIQKSGFPPGKVLSILTELQIMGLVEEIGKNHYIRS